MTVIFKIFSVRKHIENFNRLKLLQKSAEFIKNNKAFKISSVCVIGLVCLSLALFFSGITVGFDVKYSGRVIGTVSNQAVCNEAKVIAVKSINGEYAHGTFAEPKLIMTLTITDRLDNAHTVADAMIENTENLVFSSALCVNGQTVICGDEDYILSALDARKDEFYVEDAENTSEFVDEVEIRKGYFLKEKIKGEAEISEIVEALEVKTTASFVTESEIPYETKRVKTDKKSVGYYAVTTDGEYGVSQSSVVVEYINGKEASRRESSARVVKEPIDEVITIGTAPIKTTKQSNKSYVGFGFPLSKGGYRISSYFGDGRNHKGVDLCAKSGAPIYAVSGGTVVYSGYDSDYGYNVIIDHGTGIKTRYAHASELYVSAGQVVSGGEHIAAVGSTGYSTGNHLHFEVIVNGTRVNPAPYINLK